MLRLYKIAALCALCASLSTAAVGYGTPATFTYQGKIATVDGRPLNDDSYGVRIALYTTATGGTAFWSTETSVITSRGVFSTELGPFTASDLNKPEIWIEVRLSGQEPFGRQRVNAVPYAIRAADLVLPYSGSLAYNNPIFSVDQTGSGSCGMFMVHNPAGNGYALYAYTNGTNCALYALSAGSSGDTAKFEKNTGSGSAAVFRAYGGSNLGSAIDAYSTTVGPVIKATTDGASTAAGSFKITNTTNAQPALYASSDGTGSAIYAYSGTSAKAVQAMSSGSGAALYAHASYGGSALQASSSGTGVAVNISSTNTSTFSPVVRIAGATGNPYASALEVTNNGQGYAAVEAHAPQGAVAGLFTAHGTIGAPAVYIDTDRDHTPALQVQNNSDVNPVAANFYGNVEVTGNVHVTSSLTTGPNNVGTPLGYAFFNAAGTRLSGTANLTCTRTDYPNGTINYKVHIEGHTFSEGPYIVLVTSLSSGGAKVPKYWVNNGDIGIEFTYLYNNTSTSGAFSIVIYYDCSSCGGAGG